MNIGAIPKPCGRNLTELNSVLLIPYESVVYFPPILEGAHSENLLCKTGTVPAKWEFGNAYFQENRRPDEEHGDSYRQRLVLTTPKNSPELTYRRQQAQNRFFTAIMTDANGEIFIAKRLSSEDNSNRGEGQTPNATQWTFNATWPEPAAGFNGNIDYINRELQLISNSGFTGDIGQTPTAWEQIEIRVNNNEWEVTAEAGAENGVVARISSTTSSPFAAFLVQNIRLAYNKQYRIEVNTYQQNEPFLVAIGENAIRYFVVGEFSPSGLNQTKTFIYTHTASTGNFYLMLIPPQKPDIAIFLDSVKMFELDL